MSQVMVTNYFFFLKSNSQETISHPTLKLIQKYIKEVVDSKWHLISITDKAEIGKLTYTNPGTLSLELCLP